ncbi:hypothetical protein BJ742DRAFT_328821 [Cladochytrium replicatum]|nr:hypothetical protein BJ742DRAFT_328821 [Cladochytrium replicatum]
MSPTPGPTMDTRGGYEPQQHASGEYDYQQNYYSSGYDEEYQENQNAHRQHHYAPSVSEAPSHHPTNVGSASQYQMQQHQQHYADAADFVYDEELQQQQAKMLQQYHHQMTQQFMTPMIKAPFANNPTFGLIPLPATKVLLERLKGWQTLLSNLVNHLQIVADQEKAAAENLGKSVVNLSSLIVPIRSNPAVSKALMEEPSDHFGLDVFAGHGSVKSFFNTFYETQARRTAAHYAASQFLETQTLAALRMIAEEVEHKIEDAAEEWAVLDQELAQDGEKFVVLTQALGVLVRWQREMAVKYIQAENFLTANGLPLIPPTPSMDGSTGAMTPRAMSPMSGATPQAPLFEQQQQQQQQAGWASYLGFSKKDVKPVAGSATPQSQNGSEKSSVSTPPNGTVAPVGGVAVVEEKQILIPPFPVVAPGAANGVGPGDPWLYNTTIKHHIARCVAKQKSIRARLLDQQQNIAVFEQTVISLVQNAVSGYVEFRARQITAEVNNINQPLFRATEAMEGPIEWGQFKTDHFDILIDEDAPFVEARHMIYDGMDHPLSEIVREGPLLRLEKGGIMFKKPGWREAYFVLTAAGYLHGFPNAPVVSVDVVAGEFVQPVEKAQDENDGTVAKDQAGAPVSIAAWMVGGKKKPARKRRDTVYYDSATAKFKAQEDEEEKAKSKKDQMDDLQPEMVKNQAEALFKQLSDGALDRGEPDLCLYLPECVIAPLGMPVDGKTASGWTAMEFEIQHKGRIHYPLDVIRHDLASPCQQYAQRKADVLQQPEWSSPDS